MKSNKKSKETCFQYDKVLALKASVAKRPCPYTLPTGKAPVLVLETLARPVASIYLRQTLSDNLNATPAKQGNASHLGLDVQSSLVRFRGGQLSAVLNSIPADKIQRSGSDLVGGSQFLTPQFAHRGSATVSSLELFKTDGGAAYDCSLSDIYRNA